MLAFLLGNNPSLSIAEILGVFPEAEIQDQDENILLISGIDITLIQNKFHSIGGTIKIIQILPEIKDIQAIAHHLDTTQEGKITLGVNLYGTRGNALTEALGIKKLLKKKDRSVRVTNTKPGNLSSASTIHNKLVRKQSEINILYVNGSKYIGHTICIQDIDTYSERDTGKSRSMQVGMLPPKLAQIMINLSGADRSKIIYDPFVGMGTILIEACNRGHQALIGSDIKSDLADTARTNVQNFTNKNNLPIKDLQCFELDATKIASKKELLKNCTIVTESYLGRLFTPRDINEDRIMQEKRKLIQIYEGFFRGLVDADFIGTIVITIPFWQLGRRKIYLTKVNNLIKDLGYTIEPLLPSRFTNDLTPRGTLPYSRKDQVVGREIYKIVRK